MSERPAQQFSDQLPVLTLHGPDGCGKTTIGEAVGQNLDNVEGETLVFGSSEFANWLSAEIFEKYIGSTDRLEAGTARNASPADKTALYEDIPICLYGEADIHARTRGHVVVHSDPYLKRLTWARSAMTNDEFLEYCSQFDEYVSTKIGDIYATHAVIVEATADEAYSRISARGANGEYDPQSTIENQQLISAVDYVSNYALGGNPPFARLQPVEVKTVPNPEIGESGRANQIATLARDITRFVCQEED